MSGLYTHLRKKNLRLWRIFYRMNKRCEINQGGNYGHVKVCDQWNYNIQLRYMQQYHMNEKI